MKTEFTATVPTVGVNTGKSTNSVLASEFSKLVAKFQDQANAEMLKRKQDADEKAAEEAKKKKQEKINELLSMISKLKARIGSCGAGGNSALEAELGQLESELMMLLLFS